MYGTAAHQQSSTDSTLPSARVVICAIQMRRIRLGCISFVPHKARSLNCTAYRCKLYRRGRVFVLLDVHDPHSVADYIRLPEPVTPHSVADYIQLPEPVNPHSVADYKACAIHIWLPTTRRAR